LAFDFFDRIVDTLEEKEELENLPANPKGLSCAELFDISSEIAPQFKSAFGDMLAENAISALAPDRLIDSGFLVTKVESIEISENEKWAIRTFIPDAEVVTSKFRRQSAVRGNPWR
jgi:hypothetical protein